MRPGKTFLECMLNDLYDIHEGTDKEVLQELEKAGIDVPKARESFEKILREYRRKKSLGYIVKKREK